MFKKFLGDIRGNFAIIGAVVSVPLLLSIGLYIDYGRQTSAHSHIQALADAAALAMAAERTTNPARLRAAALRVIEADQDANTVKQVEIADLTINGEQISVRLKGKLDTSFLILANTNEAGVQAGATAERSVAANAQVEVALVLDNTYSMIEPDRDGVKRIDALKGAAFDLVDRLMQNPSSPIKVGIVPYADSVNVGTSSRGSNWLNIGADHTVPGSPASCVTKTVRSVCQNWAPTYSCTYYTDGVPMSGTCGGGCTAWADETVPPYDVCTPETPSYLHTWHGCVGSRSGGNTRLEDNTPSVPFPGFVGYYQECPTPITPLTSNLATLNAAIAAMTTNTSVYYPSTYIPAGMIWGHNVLSHRAPYNEGRPYDPRNVAPRKVVVLMTDGDNTLRLDPSDGRARGFGWWTADESQWPAFRAETDADTLAICNNMKADKIEIFSVAFMLDNAEAKNLLEQCASDSAHYFDANDASKLMQSFQQIAQSLAKVRLVR